MHAHTHMQHTQQVVPYINPPIDFVSYSNWEIEEARERAADELGPALHGALDFIACHLPPKPCVPEPRVFIGEVCGAAMGAAALGGWGVCWQPCCLLLVFVMLGPLSRLSIRSPTQLPCPPPQHISTNSLATFCSTRTARR